MRPDNLIKNKKMITPTPEFWKIFKETNGALSVTESICIINIASQAPMGIAMECGVYKGKSLISSIYGLNYDRIFVLVEPEFSDMEWWDEVEMLANSINGETHSFICEAGYSTDVITKYADYGWVFVDSGSHQDGLPMQEVKLLEDRMVEGGIIAFHDWDSQFVEVKQASDYLVSTGKYEYIPINWQEIIDYVNQNNLEEGNQSWHHTEIKNPCFVGAVRRI